jgi:hypothetical protein
MSRHILCVLCVCDLFSDNNFHVQKITVSDGPENYYSS